MGSTQAERRAFAFAPGHVTGLFVADRSARDPRAQGSRGAGIVLEVGATADAVVRPGRPDSLDVVDAAEAPLPLTRTAAEHLIPPGAGAVRVRVQHALPVGQGFGMSAAGSLAASLALAGLFRLSDQRAVEAAHLAELFGGGGLGGVAAILGGGLELRSRPGIPPRGRVVHRPFDRPVLVGVVGGPIPSPRQLARPRFLADVARVGEPILRALGSAPVPARLLDGSERFTDELGRAPLRLRHVLRGLRRRGFWAAQAMFGRSFFAVPRRPAAVAIGLGFLARGSVAVRPLRAAPDGARRLAGEPGGAGAAAPSPKGRGAALPAGRPRAVGSGRAASRPDASILTGRPSRRRP